MQVRESTAGIKKMMADQQRMEKKLDSFLHNQVELRQQLVQLEQGVEERMPMPWQELQYKSPYVVYINIPIKAVLCEMPISSKVVRGALLNH